jgi:hypothetical protein
MKRAATINRWIGNLTIDEDLPETYTVLVLT